MRFSTLFTGLLCAFAAMGLLTGCETTSFGGGVGFSSGGTHGGGGVAVHQQPTHRPGPPPHAPAHGYRQKHHKHNADLVYDSGIGVYLVSGHTGLWYQDGLFLRMAGDNWQVSVNLDGPWEQRHYDKVPSKLHKKHGHHGKQAQGNQGRGKDDGKGKGKGKGNDKGKGKGRGNR